MGKFNEINFFATISHGLEGKKILCNHDSKFPSKTTHNAPIAPIIKAIKMERDIFCRISIYPKKPLNSGANVNTAANETDDAIFSPSNINTK